MSNTLVSRQKVHDYFESEGVSPVNVATCSGILRQDLIDYLSGENKSKETHEILLAIIDFYKIR